MLAAQQGEVRLLPLAVGGSGLEVLGVVLGGGQLVDDAGERRELLAARGGAADGHHGARIPVEHGSGLGQGGDAGGLVAQARVGGVHPPRLAEPPTRRHAQRANTAAKAAARPNQVMA